MRAQHAVAAPTCAFQTMLFGGCYSRLFSQGKLLRGGNRSIDQRAVIHPTFPGCGSRCDDVPCGTGIPTRRNTFPRIVIGDEMVFPLHRSQTRYGGAGP